MSEWFRRLVCGSASAEYRWWQTNRGNKVALVLYLAALEAIVIPLSLLAAR